jgi:hypothetical protein
MGSSRVIAVLAVALVAASCVTDGPVTTVHRLGSTFEEREAAVAACRDEAMTSLPPAMETVYADDGPDFDPMPICRRDHNGRSYCPFPRLRHWQNVEQRDANASLRNLYIGSCLKGRGYTMITRPVCGTDAAKAAYLAGREHQPAESALACVAPDERFVR